MEQTHYKNGQIIREIQGDKLIYYFKNGRLKAVGPWINGLMEGEWKFYRETGQLWAVGHFKENLKDGSWIRYDRNDQVEYDEMFQMGKQLKKR